MIIDPQAPAGQDPFLESQIAATFSLDFVGSTCANPLGPITTTFEQACFGVVPGTYTVSETTLSPSSARFVSLSCDDNNSSVDQQQAPPRSRSKPTKPSTAPG